MRQINLVTVVLPVYNVEQYVAKCLDSILRQSYVNFEVVIVDDASTDRSFSICQQYAETNPDCIRVIRHEENRGPSATRNTALAEAKGDYIAFVDSDDIIHPEYLETLVEMAEEHDADLAAVGWLRFRSETALRMVKNYPCKPKEMNADEALAEVLYQSGMNNSSWAKIFARHLLKGEQAVDFENGLIYEDLDFVCRVLPLCNKVVYKSVPLYFYRRNQNSILGSAFTRKRLDVLSVTREIVGRFQNGTPQLLAAARSRQLSANFDMLRRITKSANAHDYDGDAEKCWQVICDNRHDCFHDSHVRLKNKLGIMASYMGRPFLSLLFKLS